MIEGTMRFFKEKVSMKSIFDSIKLIAIAAFCSDLGIAMHYHCPDTMTEFTAQIIGGAQGENEINNQVSSHPTATQVPNNTEAQPIKIIGTLQGHTQPVCSIDQYPVFEKGGTRIVTGSYDSTIKIWDAYTYQSLLTLSGHTGEVWVTSAMPIWFDSNFPGTVIVSGSTDTTIGVWWMYEDKLIKSTCLVGHAGRISSVVAVAPYILASGSGDGLIKIWDIRSGQCIQTLQGHTSMIEDLRLTPDQTHLISAGYDGMIKVWNLATYQCERTIQLYNQQVVLLKILGDDQVIIWDYFCYVYNWRTGELIRTFINKNDPASWGVWDMKDYDLNQLIFMRYDATMWVYDYMSGQALAQLVVDPKPELGTWKMVMVNRKMFICNITQNDVVVTEKPRVSCSDDRYDFADEGDCCTIL